MTDGEDDADGQGEKGPNRVLQDKVGAFTTLDEPTEEDVMDLMDAASEATSRSDVDAAVALAASKTEFEEGELEGRVSRKRRSGFEVEKITKVIPYADDGDVEWQFHVQFGGEMETLIFDTDEIHSSDTRFRQRILEVTDQVVGEYEDWEGTLSNWLTSVPIEEKRPIPTDNEHAIVEAIVESISAKDATTDREDFRTYPESYVFCEGRESETVGVSGTLIDTCRDRIQGEVSMRKVRSILDDMLTGNSQQIRTESGRFRVWQFDRESLNREGIELTFEEERDSDASLDGGVDG